MSLVSILAVDVLDNPSSFLNPFQFEVTFECLKDLKEGAFCALYACACVCARASGRPFVVLFRLLLLTKKKKRAPISRRCARAHTDLEWKIVYIGSAESEDYDQVLDDILVGPVTVGTKKFVFQVSASRARATFFFLVFWLCLRTCSRSHALHAIRRRRPTSASYQKASCWASRLFCSRVPTNRKSSLESVRLFFLLVVVVNVPF